jgi:hypothetical protein
VAEQFRYELEVLAIVEQRQSLDDTGVAEMAQIAVHAAHRHFRPGCQHGLDRHRPPGLDEDLDESSAVACEPEAVSTHPLQDLLAEGGGGRRSQGVSGHEALFDVG